MVSKSFIISFQFYIRMIYKYKFISTSKSIKSTWHVHSQTRIIHSSYRYIYILNNGLLVHYNWLGKHHTGTRCHKYSWTHLIITRPLQILQWIKTWCNILKRTIWWDPCGMWTICIIMMARFFYQMWHMLCIIHNQTWWDTKYVNHNEVQILTTDFDFAAEHMSVIYFKMSSLIYSLL